MSSYKDNITQFITDKIFYSIIQILKDSYKFSNDYTHYCREQLFILFDKILQSINIVEEYKENTDSNLIQYIIKKN
jgi:hypothetical protein